MSIRLLFALGVITVVLYFFAVYGIMCFFFGGH
jgi:hypothetical protein